MVTKTSIAAVAASALLVAAGAYGWWWWTEARFLERTDNAYVEADISVISPRVAGIIRAVVVEDNQPVAAGQALVILDDRALRAALKEAEARRASQHAALKSIDKELSLQQANVLRAAAEAASAEADRERAELDLTRYAGLAAAQWVSAQRHDLARADAQKAQAIHAASAAALVSERRRVEMLAARRQEAEAALAEAEAALQRARLDMESATVRAPVNGVVANRTAHPGRHVSPGTPLLAISPVLRLRVVANFKETQLEGIRAGQPARLRFDAFPNRVVAGRVASISPASGARFSILPPENATGNFTRIVQRIPVRIELPGDQPLAGRLRPGMSAVVTVDTREPFRRGARWRF